ncbi:MAG: nucleotide sugar dehydrogenase, partial [Chloroflexi bacterium]|nr:nucleotide sugar dehydrogenase [Chloroflexota bacterium]
MKISVFGLGWVGAVTAVCLADNGHEVWGVDNDPKKVEWIRSGIAPVREPGLGEKLARVLEAGALNVTLNAYEAVAATDIAMVCVGTPTRAGGGTDLSYIESVIESIGGALREIGNPITVVVRSTVPIGTTQNVILPRLEEVSGMKVGRGLQLLTNPEFLREGTALKDFQSPPFNVVGRPQEACEDGVESMQKLYEAINAPFIALNFQEAELLKLACNGFHALKVAFANEIGTLAGRLDADPVRVMEAFALDTKLNVSRAYLRPGFAFGGSCLPKDVRAINHVASTLDIELPLCESILPSNERHLDRIAGPIIASYANRIGVVGLVFKSGTD